MCFTVSIFASTHTIETDSGSIFDDPEDYTPFFHVSAFTHPRLPFITGADPEHIRMLQWGLIPRWTKDEAAAKELREMTLNARRETIYDKPSFRDAIVKRRGLLPVNAFIEWRHDKAVKQPHLVRLRGSEIFTLGCIWEEWTNKESGEQRQTFSIVTTDANNLMSYVHNVKQRMPVIIPKDQREAWLHAEDREVVEPLMRPLEDGLLEAFPITREVSRIKVNSSEVEFLEPVGEVIA
ncbi:MAG: SOS response-associated peptidase [Candidatus Kapabacteria bacterium]|nr:SOS response-associated peptidase [Candidatus Kapabacteria bacterium]